MDRGSMCNRARPDQAVNVGTGLVVTVILLPMTQRLCLIRLRAERQVQVAHQSVVRLHHPLVHP